MREAAERGEGVIDLDAIERGMLSSGFDDRGRRAELGCLREKVVTVDRSAVQCDEQTAGLERASIDADAQHESHTRLSGMAESAAAGLDHFGECERGLIAGNWRRHFCLNFRAYIVADTLCRIVEAGPISGILDMAPRANQPSDSIEETNSF